MPTGTPSPVAAHWSPGDPCPLDGSDHLTGSTTAHQRGCRCDDTMTAHEYRLRKQRRNVNRAKLGYYIPDRLTDAAPTLERLDQLTARGHRPPYIAQRAGLEPDLMYRIIRTRPARVRSSTETAVLSVPLDIPPGPDRRPAVGTVPARPMMYRLRALGSAGHTIESVAQSIVPTDDENRDVVVRRWAQALVSVRNGETERTRLVTANAVRTAYAALWDAAPDTSTPALRAASTLVRRTAERQRWPMPMDLDDDRLERDPDYAPRRAYRPRDA